MILFIVAFVLGGAFCYIPLVWLLGRCMRIRQQKQAERNRLVYLTFDDGPGNRLTPEILDILHKHNIRATFFLLGSNITGREMIVQRILQEGHCIASHSFSHLHAWKQWPWKVLADIRKGYQSIETCLHHQTNRYPFRPPFGKMNLLSYLYIKILNYSIYYWSIDSQDTWTVGSRNPEYAAGQIFKRGGGIVLFHDFDRTTSSNDSFVLQSLNGVIQTAQRMNLRFVAMEKGI